MNIKSIIIFLIIIAALVAGIVFLDKTVPEPKPVTKVITKTDLN